MAEDLIGGFHVSPAFLGVLRFNLDRVSAALVADNEQSMALPVWNHNVHYHRRILDVIPPDCGRALDVGCGDGHLAQELALKCKRVVAIDLDSDALRRARMANTKETRIEFLHADVMTEPFPQGSFDLITAVATLHHLPLIPALARFRSLLKPGGVLAVIGLYRMEDAQDYVCAAAGWPASRLLRWVRTYQEVQAPLRAPAETLRTIRAACDLALPGSAVRRRLLFRYTLIWRKP